MKTLTYLGITAEANLWYSIGLREYSNTDFAVSHMTDTGAASDGAIIEARITSGYDDGRALVWLIQERRRQREHQAQLDTQRKAGDDAIHAARIQRQAAELACKARGLKLDE